MVERRASTERLGYFSDAVFAVKKSLIKEFARVDDPGQAASYGLDGPFCVANFDIVLLPDAEN